jgi:serine/threonine protein kinase
METERICQSCRKPVPAEMPMGLCPECLIKSGFPSGIESKSETGNRSPFTPPSLGEMAKLFPQLEILELIGQGGMGAVYKARQKQLQRMVALKILPPGIGAEPAFAERFTREAQALAQLNHPGIVTLYEFGRAGGMHFFLMEFVDGVNLGQALAHRRISPREALSIVPQICDALQFAHDQGIVHRDIKSENILLDRRGRVKVADFGLALLTGGAIEPRGRENRSNCPTALTEAGKVVGTPRYMSPEQLERPGAVDHRADIYALGVVFYQMLTGELPGKRIEAPSKKVHIDVRLDGIVLHALAKDPERRYQHASEVKSAVETLAARRLPVPGKVRPRTTAAVRPPAGHVSGTGYSSAWRSRFRSSLRSYS